MVLLFMQMIISLSKLNWKNREIWGDTKSMRRKQKEEKKAWVLLYGSTFYINNSIFTGFPAIGSGVMFRVFPES